MKTVLTSLILLAVYSLNAIAQDTIQWELPDGAKARLGKGMIYNVKYSSDGTRLAVASSSGVWLYDSVTSNLVALISSCSTFGAIDVAFSRDGGMFAAGAVGIICVWDAVTGEQKHSLQLTEDFPLVPIRRFALSPDADTLAVGIMDTVDLWDVVTGKRIHTLSGRLFGNIVSLAFSPDGRKLASGHESPSAGHSSGSTTIRVWDAETGELETSLTKFLGLPRSLAFSPDGRTLASGNFYSHLAGDQAGSISLWDVATWELKLELNTSSTGVVDGGGVHGIAYSPDGRTLASGHSIDQYYGDEFGTVHLWDVETGENIRTLDGHPNDVRSVDFSRDGSTLAIASGYSSLALWDVATGTQKRLLEGYTSSVFSVAFSPDGRTVASGSWDGTIHLWDAVTGSHKHRLDGHTDLITSLAFSPVGGTLASGSKDTTIRLWDADTGAHKRTLENLSSAPIIAFSPDGRTLAWSEVLHLWDVHQGARIRTLTGYSDKVDMVAYSPDGRTIAGANYSEIRLWDADTGALQHTLEGGKSIVFSPDSRTLAALKGGKIQLWDVGTGKQTGTLDMLTTAISYIAFTRNGRVLAVSRSRHGDPRYAPDTLRLWDAVTGENIRTLEGHSGNVYSVAFSPDGGTLASGSREGTVLLWDLFPSPDPLENEQPHVVEPPQVMPDVNRDGVVDIRDLVLVAGQLGNTAENPADVNRDGPVDILDLVIVAGMIDNAAGTPLMDSRGTDMLRTTQVREWLEDARRLDLTDAAIPTGIEYLETLLAALTPERTALLPNYPNPFNPETWIPYQLARESFVGISIYSAKGILVRHLDLGLQPEGFYTDKHHAAYWDGRNEGGELLASGVYVYVFRAGSYRASRRMAIVR